MARKSRTKAPAVEASGDTLALRRDLQLRLYKLAKSTDPAARSEFELARQQLVALG